MPAEFIYTTYRLARHYPPDRTVLEDISLSFYPGAKIGVIGPNGAGKSSLLRIMAGPRRRVHRRRAADARIHRRLPRPGAAARRDEGRQGQRPRRRPPRPGPHRPVQRRHGQMVRPRRRLRGDRCRAVGARGQDQRRRRVEPRAQRRHRDGRAPLSSGRPGCDHVQWRRAAARGRSRGCSSSIPTCCCSTSRRTISTPSRSTGSSNSSTSTTARSWP